MRGLRAVILGASLGLGLAMPLGAFAQSIGGPLSQGVVQSPVLVVQFDTVFADSAFGQRITAELEAEGAAISAENRQIEAQLTEEERQLTVQRETMAPEAFRALADAFDAKVQRLRAEQDAKARALGTKSETARRDFLTVAQPVLEQLMAEAGAAVILERRAVFAALDAIDITDQAIARVNEAIGDGAAPPEQ
ncbi:OmpH family outer membrane protein [Tropicibacter naphthalenivorans]|uniref:Outer membrane protein n=1 Tax=Tropicibacter naphthalenivorans TaxID=441103 RepID=A0A0P1GSY5_9RHOB|nr:OmpH family outer membrane protein [Tropicibacter naphthalenivorans]CUH77184.1 Outer membrane protein [Tropicibacter naphthalenivorans]SMC60110.1 periplasmic chaperone for outer membrane proteins Skp [Tropicibacter naphthalenivorans]